MLLTLIRFVPGKNMLRLKYSINIESSSFFICKFFAYSAYVTMPASAWTLVVLSIDRMLSVVYPKRFLILRKMKFQIIIVLIIFCFNIFYNLGIIIGRNYKEVENFDNLTNTSIIKRSCVFDDYLNKVYYWMDPFNLIIFPFILMFASTIVSVVYIFKSRFRLFVKKTSGETKAGDVIKKMQKDIHYAIVSIALNFTFFIFLMPLELFYLLGEELEYDTWLLVYAFLNIPFYINSGSVFYINFWFNSTFRSEIMDLFKKRIIIIEGTTSNTKF